MMIIKGIFKGVSIFDLLKISLKVGLNFHIFVLNLISKRDPRAPKKPPMATTLIIIMTSSYWIILWIMWHYDNRVSKNHKFLSVWHLECQENSEKTNIPHILEKRIPSLHSLIPKCQKGVSFTNISTHNSQQQSFLSIKFIVHSMPIYRCVILNECS